MKKLLAVVLSVLFLASCTTASNQIAPLSQSISPSSTPVPSSQAVLAANSSPSVKPTSSPSPLPTIRATLKPTTKPIVKPTVKPTTKPTVKATPAAASNSKSYTNSQGNKVQSPTYYDSKPAGASAKCADGTYSFSASRRGTCSHHGGVAIWY